jgi:long-chain fatty acid transport protein
MRLVSVSVALFLAVATALGGGFQVSDHSARAMGVGGAFVATVNDVSSLYANPAGMSFMGGTHLSIGTTIMMPDNSFTFADPPGSDSKTQTQVIFPPNFSLSHTFEGGYGVGVSASVPYSLRNDWSPDWPGGRVTTHSEIRVVFVSPAFSVNVFRSLSLGFSLNVAWARLVMDRRIGFDALGEPDGSQSLHGSAETSYGFTAGLLYHPNEFWTLGAAYRSRTANSIENGNATYAEIPTDQMANFPNSNFSTTLTTPDHLSGGISIHPAHWLYAEGEVQYVFWSALSSVTLDFVDARIQSNPAIEKSIPLQWNNSISARGGIEISLGDVNLRAGYAFEQTPVPDPYMRPSFPDANRNVFSGGIGYAVSEDLRLDFAFSIAKFKNRSVTNSLVEYQPGAYLNGTYTSSLTMIGINMSYSWD